MSKPNYTLRGVLCAIAVIGGLIGSCYWSIHILKGWQTQGNQIRDNELQSVAKQRHPDCTVVITNRQYLDTAGWLSDATVTACGTKYQYHYRCETDHWNGGTIECVWLSRQKNGDRGNDAGSTTEPACK